MVNGVFTFPGCQVVFVSPKSADWVPQSPKQQVAGEIVCLLRHGWMGKCGR